MDTADRAAELQEILNETALRGRRAATVVRESAGHCIACGLEIPSARQLAVPGCQMCVECAEDYERER